MSNATGFLRRAVHRIEGIDALDDVARRIEPYVDRLTASPSVKRTLSGAPLGHRLHPMLTDIPIGSWTSATVLDLVAWRSGDTAARRLTAIGVLAALPTAMTGLSDWKDTYGKTKRVGVVHAASNTVALGFEFASWRARGRGHHVRGAVLGLCGVAVATVGGYLGGHLVFAQRSGVDADISVVGDDGWHRACRLDELDEDTPLGVTVAGARVVVVQRRGRVYALAATCSHAGGPLDEGRVVGDAIQCPWHGSEFCLADGEIERGPAATPQPVYETRVRSGAIEIRLADPDEQPVGHAEVAAPVAERAAR
jgi:nitrite reductase/ring-hydroxylating ferredoxin subunit/uncharacterized membrane protein